jgi:chromosome segregation ATPase
MKFRDALELAKRHPGAWVTRGAGEVFVVHGIGSCNDRGQVITAGQSFASDACFDGSDKDHSDLTKERLRHSSDIARADQVVRSLRSELTALRSAHQEALSKIKGLEEKIAKVDRSEWERIRIAEQGKRVADSRELRNQRQEQICSCRGEVENCVRCWGRGVITVDGHGNIV